MDFLVTRKATPIMDKHTADLDCCTDCGRLLNDLEGWRCGPCTAKHQNALEAQTMTWYDPSDAELARRDALIERGWRELGAILFGVVVLLIAGTMMWGQNAHAQDDRTVTRTINDRPYTWTLPEAGCTLLRGYEDMSARAWCPSGMMAYDPDGSDDRAAGVWYEVSNTR